MLAIRLQRRGRKGHAQYRIVVQDKDLSPKSGRVVYNLGPYNPHTKEATIDKDKADFYLKNGARPSNTVAKILNDGGVKLPKWVEIDTSANKSLKNPDKLRKNQPDEPADKTPVDEVAASSDATEEETEETATEKAEDSKSEETPKEPETKSDESKPEAEKEKSEEAASEDDKQPADDADSKAEAEEKPE